MAAMAIPTVWMVLTAAGAEGRAAPLTAALGEGTRGHGVRRVDVRDGSADIRESAGVGTRLAYEVLAREKYLDRHVVARYQAGTRLVNVHGRSADIAFALAFAAGAVLARRRERVLPPAVAATGMLGDDGAIQGVDGLAEKLSLAFAVLPPGGLIIFPSSNEREVSGELRQEAARRDITLMPTARIERALSHLGIDISIWLDCPFRGLEPFEFRHAAIFAGRGREAEEVALLLGRRGALLVQGPSGSGKSSLALAGVIPALLRRGLGVQVPRDRIRWGLLRPRAVTADIDPDRELANLAAAAQSSWSHGETGGLTPYRPSDPATLLDASASLSADRLLAWLYENTPDPEQTQHVWVLDQMEEWFQGPFQPGTLRTLCRFLVELAERGVWLIATLSSAAAPCLDDHPDLTAVFGEEGRYVLSPQHGPAFLEAVVREPAKAARLRFEPGLDTEIIAAASHGGADVLPLLELLLTELYERRDPSHNEMRFEDYRAVGGLDGVVSARAEAVHQECSAEVRAMVPPLLWTLATRGAVVHSDYPAGHPMYALLAAFRKRRLLVEDRTATGTNTLRPAHEALLRHWPRAVEARSRNEADIRLWRDLIRESGQWRRGERTLIPCGPQLTAAGSLYKRRTTHWSPSDRSVLDYLCASLRQCSRRRILAALAVGIPAIIAGRQGIGKIYDYSMGITRIKFDDIAVPEGDHVIAAGPYLRRFGVSISARSPDNALVVIRSNVGLYEGQAANPISSEHFLTEEANPATAPISFTLSFDRPVTEVRLLRAELWAATESGVTHPAWKATAFDASDKVVATASEELLRSWDTVPATWHVIKVSDGRTIARLRIESDFRLEGRPFAGFQSVLIQEIDLVH